MMTFEDFFILYVMNKIELRSGDNEDLEIKAHAIVSSCLSNDFRSDEEDEMLEDVYCDYKLYRRWKTANIA